MNLKQIITIVIADDHAPLRSGFSNVFGNYYADEIKFVAEAGNGIELLEQVALHRPRVVLTDIRMPGMNGVEASKIIKQQFPETAVLAMSAFGDGLSIMSMLDAGINGYLLKTCLKEEIMEAIRAVARDEYYYCSEVLEKMSTQASGFKLKQQKTISLSIQEEMVMKLVCKELSTKEIAVEMGLATRTVEHYREHIMEKVNARNVVGIALSAVAHGIVQLSELM